MMAEERDLWAEIAAAEQLIASARSVGHTQDEGELWLGLGTCYYYLELMEEAISAFERAISLFRMTQNGPKICSASVVWGVHCCGLTAFCKPFPYVSYRVGSGINEKDMVD